MLWNRVQSNDFTSYEPIYDWLRSDCMSSLSQRVQDNHPFTKPILWLFWRSEPAPHVAVWRHGRKNSTQIKTRHFLCPRELCCSPSLGCHGHVQHAGTMTHLSLAWKATIPIHFIIPSTLTPQQSALAEPSLLTPYQKKRRCLKPRECSSGQKNSATD